MSKVACADHDDAVAVLTLPVEAKLREYWNRLKPEDYFAEEGSVYLPEIGFLNEPVDDELSDELQQIGACVWFRPDTMTVMLNGSDFYFAR